MITILGSGELADSLSTLVSKEHVRDVGATTRALADSKTDEGEHLIVAFDHLDPKRIRDIAVELEGARKSWLIVYLKARYLVFSPVFGPYQRACVQCFLKRVLAAPPGVSCAETEYALTLQYSRGRAGSSPAFSNPVVRFAFEHGVRRIANASNAEHASCSLFDQIGLSHTTAQIVPVHGCVCRDLVVTGIDRFSTAFKAKSFVNT